MKALTFFLLLLVGCSERHSYQARPSELKAGATACVPHSGVVFHEIDGLHNRYDVMCLDGTYIEGQVP